MKSRTVIVGLVAALLGACAPEQESSSNFVLVADMQELMAHVVDPAADVYWAAGGVIVDAEGEHFQIPETEEDWIALSDAAMILAESGNLMMMEGRAIDQGAWMTMSQQLIEVSRRALEAADARNLDAVFDMGAEVYYVCTNCHATYAIGSLRPNDDRVN